jgi:hypothetical protein
MGTRKPCKAIPQWLKPGAANPATRQHPPARRGFRALPYWKVALANAHEKEFSGKKTVNRER